MHKLTFLKIILKLMITITQIIFISAFTLACEGLKLKLTKQDICEQSTHG
tara:strand:- start:486 stop:635 length:150 start_codon:yes stop_codon:yes gene_type:complete